MTDSLSAVLRSLQAAGLDIDAEAALDAVWLGLRIRERRGMKPEEAQTGQALAIGGSPAAGSGGGAPLTEDDIALRRDTRLARTGEFATPLPSPSTQVQARALTLTRAAALPDSRGLIRALRPLRRRVATPGSRALDIETTVRRAAEEDLWIPSFYPTRERWLDVLLVADHGLSMILWKDTIDEFERALRNSGAFRTVRSWWLESDGDTLAVSAKGRAPPPAEPKLLTRLVRSPGRSVILLLSDCVGARWHDGAIPNLMAQWSQSLPLALLQVTPEWFWARTALGDTVDSRFRSATAAATNGQLVWDSSPFGPGGVSAEFAKTLLRVPAATLTPNALGRLADLIAGVGREWTPGVVFYLTCQSETPAPGPSAATPSDRVNRFLSLASSDAKRLAASYAASPVRTLGVLRLLRHDLVPESGAFAEAEVLLGGILRVRREDARWDLGPSVGLDFFPGVQPLLLDGALATDVVRVLAHAAAVAKSGLGETFTAWLTDPSSGAGQLDPESSDFAKATAESLARLGGDFARIVKSSVAPPEEESHPPAEGEGNAAEVASDDAVLSVEFMISGRVAGVGFRTFVQQNATELGVQGTAENLPDGRIKVLASGPVTAIDKLEERLRRGPPAAKVDQVVKTILSPEPAPAVSIRGVMETPPPMSQKWPADRALLLVHGIGSAQPGDDGALVSQLTNILSDQPKPYAIYVFYYDAVNDWFAQKGNASPAFESLVRALRSRLDATDLGHVVADFVGNVISPILLLDARDAVRTALLQQLQQIVLDGKLAGVRQPAQHLSIIAHSMGCFHTFEALHAAANSPSQGLAPATDGVQFDNVIFMASPVQVIRTVGESIRGVIPRSSDLACLSQGPLEMPSEDTGTGTLVRSAKRTISITGNLDPVGGYFFRKQLPWGYMNLPSQISRIDQQESLDIQEEELASMLQASLNVHRPPAIQPENPHDWSAYVARHGYDLSQWLNV